MIQIFLFILLITRNKNSRWTKSTDVTLNQIKYEKHKKQRVKNLRKIKIIKQ